MVSPLCVSADAPDCMAGRVVRTVLHGIGAMDLQTPMRPLHSRDAAHLQFM